MVHVSDSLSFLGGMPDSGTDVVFYDPPYGLGSEVVIRPDGKPDYSKASDFMSKWDMPTGEYWESWFKEAYRTLKHGGYCVMYGMDRQLLLFKYYAALAGFSERQSLYWYFISNFPKASDLSKNLDKNAGAEREVVGCGVKGRNLERHGHKGDMAIDEVHQESIAPNITVPTTPLAKKYDGYKYSVSPLKQTNETIIVFQKPYKTGSCLHDTLAYEAGDMTCGCGALDIDGGRCGTREKEQFNGEKNGLKNCYNGGDFRCKKSILPLPTGRYPAQTFISPEAGEVLDRQSGMLKTGAHVAGQPRNAETKSSYVLMDKTTYSAPANVGGCSKILHKCPYEEGEMDLYMYAPKVSKAERNGGLEAFPITLSNRDNAALTSAEDRPPQSRNPHPTLKPISLNERILRLFKTPNPQKILYPFAGSGSEIIGGIRAGFTDWEACEVNPEYVAIAEARIRHWSEKTKQGQLISA